MTKREVLGPTIYTAGPPLLGNNVSTPEVAEREQPPDIPATAPNRT